MKIIPVKPFNLENLKKSNYLELINLINNIETNCLIELGEHWVGVGENSTVGSNKWAKEGYSEPGYTRTLMGVTIKIEEAKRHINILITADGNIGIHCSINDENGFNIFNVPINKKIITWLLENDFIKIN